MGVIGPLVEVPVLIGLVHVSLCILRNRYDGEVGDEGAAGSEAILGGDVAFVTTERVARR